jgi:hypothetical protein
LPPLALPAVGYWLAMGVLTYAFTQLGPYPLDEAVASERSLAPVPPAEAPPPEPSLAEAEPGLGHEAEPKSAEPPLVDPGPPNSGEDLAATPASSEPRAAEVARRDEPGPRERREVPLAASLPEPPAGPLAFPEFTDSSPRRSRERGGDGPRIDALFERADDAPPPVAPSAPSAPPSGDEDAPRGPITSCEAAIARNNEQVSIGGPRGPADVTREAYASILQNGRYLARCQVPERSVVEICAAVKHGRAVGITVVSSPPSPGLNACVRGAVAGLKFPNNERLDVTHTRFDALIKP